MIDTDAWIFQPVFPLASVQWNWLRNDLSQVDRRETPWIVLIGHRAMYCTRDNRTDCNIESETIRWGFENSLYGIEPLMLEFGVDLYFAGHTHHYMRTWPVKKAQLMQTNYINPRGPVHIQSGIGGVDGPDEFHDPLRVYDAWRDESYAISFSRITVHNATHLTVSQHKGTDSSILDQFVIEQNNHGPF